MSSGVNTTFIRMLHGSLKPEDESIEVPEFRVSYKPQKISPKFPGSVSFLLLALVNQVRETGEWQGMHSAGSTPPTLTRHAAALMLVAACVVHGPVDGACKRKCTLCSATLNRQNAVTLGACANLRQPLACWR